MTPTNYNTRTFDRKHLQGTSWRPIGEVAAEVLHKLFLRMRRAA